MVVNILQLFFQTPTDFLEEFFRGSGKCISAFLAERQKSAIWAKRTLRMARFGYLMNFDRPYFKVWKIFDFFGTFRENAFGMYFWPERQKFAISAETAQFWGFGIGPATRQPLIRIPAEASHRESLQGASLSSTGFTASQSIFIITF